MVWALSVSEESLGTRMGRTIYTNQRGRVDGPMSRGGSSGKSHRVGRLRLSNAAVEPAARFHDGSSQEAPLSDIEPVTHPEPGVWTDLAGDAELEAQPRGREPFALAVKANIAVRGFRRSAGCRGLDLVPQDADAPVVAALREAGAVVVGMTNMHELAFGITSNNSAFGPVRNPLDPERAAGGSSGGSAAAVAQGDVPVALGTDTGGSVTIPASLCGVVGFRPSTGRWPGAGVVGLSWTRDTPGVFTRTVGMAERVDHAVTGAGESERIERRPRLGIPAELVDDLDPATREAFTEALSRCGTAIETVEVEMGSILELTRAAEMPIVLWESRRLLADVAARALGLAPEAAFEHLMESVLSPDVHGILEASVSHPVEAVEYALAQSRVVQSREHYAAMLVTHDLDGLIFPGTPSPAPILGQDDVVQHLGEEISTFELYTRNAGPGTILGVPMLTLPVPVPADGLPVGITLQGQRLGDRRILALGRDIEALLQA